MYARMKKNVFLWMAVCMAAMVLGCKDKAKSQADAETDAQEESLEAEEDGAEADDVLMPMFFAGLDGDYQLMLYWSNLVEPELDEEYPSTMSRSTGAGRARSSSAAMPLSMSTCSPMTAASSR